MSSVFESHHRWRDMLRFSQDALFILYEHNRSPEAKKYYAMDPASGNACFVLGNIHAYNDELLQGVNLAQWILRLRCGGHSWHFLKNFRGAFNIILWEKSRLFFINDLLGLCPMYIFRVEEGCFFCNEAEPIAEMKKDHLIDKSAMVDFLVYGFIPQGRTFFQGLHNQSEGSVFTIDKLSCHEEPYATFQPLSGSSRSFAKNLNLLNDYFKEAVAIRAQKDQVLSTLTGGWDTRFIIANLLALNKKITVFTVELHQQDLAIARRIAARFNMEHIIKKKQSLPAGLKNEYALRFRTQDSRLRAAQSQRSRYNKNQAALASMEFFMEPIFSGGFGTELMGCPPLSFITRLSLNKEETARLIFSDRFLRNSELQNKTPCYKNHFFKHSDPSRQNYVHCFLPRSSLGYCLRLLMCLWNNSIA